ncbi:type II toxin-antitoxin system VapB family antitoxin [Nocardia rhizosphaerae]|uniref:Type II toxin-antitoxin system VapB family antitoxin n=1 Tax=Nocardia rhizosphaerae TaxID=1691571 RepID=A0ABV8L5F2_9NOCA
MGIANVDVDDEILAEAMRLLGTETEKDTVNRALHDCVQRLTRLEALNRLVQRADRGGVDEAIAAYERRKRASSGEV